MSKNIFFFRISSIFFRNQHQNAYRPWKF